MIGGMQPSTTPNAAVMTAQNRMIDSNFKVVEKAPLKVARCSIPLAVVKDRYIFACGGLMNQN
jgi:hypothetical protein